MSAGLQLLRAIVETGARTEVRQLVPELFTADELPAFDFVQAHYRRHGMLPSVAVCLENRFALPVAPQPVGYYRQRCLERALFNTVSTEQPGLVRAMQSRDMTGAVEVIDRLHYATRRMQAQDDVHTLHELTTGVLETYEERRRNPGLRGVTLGWAYLDELTNGAEPGDVVTFVARPGMGKSMLLIHMAREAWARGHSVLFVSMEMTAPQIAERFVGLHAGFNPRYLKRGELSTYARGMAYSSLASVETGAAWHVLSGGLEKSVPVIDAAVQEFSPDIVYVDASYLLMPSGPKGKRSQWELLAEVGKEIKQLAMARRRPVVQTVQFNREVKKTKSAPDLAQIGGTDVVGQISTIAIAITEGDAPNERTRRKLTIMKNREGDVGEMQVQFLFDPPDFSFVPAEAASGPLDTSWML